MSIGLGSTIEELVKAVNSSGSSITILSASVTYQASSSGTTVPSGTWSTSIPSVTNGQYLWTKTYVKYSDNTETTSYSVGYKGTNGSTPDISGKANLSGGNTFTGNQVFTGYLDIRGTAAEKHFKTRGIAGSDGNGTLSDLYLQYASDNKTFFGKNGTSSLNADGSISINGKKAATVDQIPTVPTKVSQLTNDSGFTKNTGTVTSVAVKMNGVIKGTITNSGTIDLGTILTAHQDISGKADKSSLATVATSGSYNDLQNKPTIPTNYVTTDTTQDITGAKTFKAPANISGSEQATVWFETSNGGRVGFGKEGPNSGTGIFFDQVKGTRRLNFRASATAGAIVWEQPEQGAQLYIDLGKKGVDHRRISMPSSGGTLALTSQIKTKISQLTNDSGYTTNKGTVTKVKVNGSEKSPDADGVVDLGTINGGSGGGSATYIHCLHIKFANSVIKGDGYVLYPMSSNTIISNPANIPVTNSIGLPMTGYVYCISQAHPLIKGKQYQTTKVKFVGNQKIHVEFLNIWEETEDDTGDIIEHYTAEATYNVVISSVEDNVYPRNN